MVRGFRLRGKQGLHKVDDRLYRRRGQGHGGEGREGGRDIGVGRVESEVVRHGDPALHGDEVHNAGADKGHGGSHHRGQPDDGRGIEGGGGRLHVQVRPLGESPVLRAGKPDLLDAVDESVHQAPLPGGGDHGLLVDAHLHPGRQQADGQGRQGDDEAGEDQAGREGEDLAQVDEGEDARHRGGEQGVHDGGTQGIHVGDILVQFTHAVIPEEGRRKGKDPHHGGGGDVHVQLIPDPRQQHVFDYRQQDRRDRGKEQEGHHSHQQPRASRRDDRARQDLVQLRDHQAHQRNGCRGQEDGNPVPGREAGEHIAQQVLQLQFPHGQGTVEAQGFLGDVRRGMPVDFHLRPGGGIRILIAAHFRGQDGDDRARILQGADHRAHGVVLPAPGQDDLPVQDAGGGQEEIQTVPQALHVAGHRPLLDAHVLEQVGNRVVYVLFLGKEGMDLASGHRPGDVFKGVAEKLPFMFFPELYLIVKPAHLQRLLSYSLLTRSA